MPDQRSRNFKRSVEAWAQGDIVTGVGQFWATPNDVDPLTSIRMSRAVDGPYRVFTWDGKPADSTKTLDTPDWDRTYSIVTSQTCNVAPTGPGLRQHTVQVSPCERYDHREKSIQLSIERGEYIDLMAVPGVPSDGEWCANLRISMAISKAILHSQAPVHGFEDEAHALAFSERVAAKFRRPALHDALSGDMTTSLCRLVADARGAEADWPEMIEQFRLEVIAGTRLAPAKVRIMAVTLSKLESNDKKDLRKWQGAQDKVLKRAHHISLAPMRYIQLREISVVEYRSAVQLRVPELGQSLQYI
jgi:hypothetical protein